MDASEKIKDNKNAILRGEQTPHGQTCRNCGAVVEKYKLHSFRERTFLVVVTVVATISRSSVRKVLGALGVWKCPECGKAFTDYPDFALPYRRYIIREILKRSHDAYLETPDATYEDASKSRGMATLHEGPEGESGRRLSPSTVWRWLGFLGGLKETLRHSLQMIRGRDSESDLHRQTLFVPERKYRSQERRRTLQTAWRLCLADGAFRKYWGISIFHDFAIRYQ
jgi:hypothetical protein